MLRTNEARQVVYKLLSDRLGPDFNLKKSAERFVRSFDGGLDALYVGFWAWPPQFVFSVTPAVRIDEIEKLYCKVFDVSIRNTDTVATQLWRFDGPDRPERDVPLPDDGSPYYFTFSDEQTATDAMDSMSPWIAERILPFFGRIRSIRDAHRELNVDCFDTTNGRIAHGVVAGFLADRPGWPQLVQRYRTELLDWPEPNRDAFETAVGRLEDSAG